MAWYFFEISPTYVRQTSKDIFIRRKVVCNHLKSNYKVPKFKDDEMFRAIQGELSSQGIEISTSTYQVDKVTLRSAYLWLQANETEKADLESKNNPIGKAAIQYLKKDGLLTWEELNRSKTQAPDSIPESLSVEALPIPKGSLLGLKLSQLNPAQDVLNSIGALVSNIELVIDENAQLKAASKELQERNQKLVKANEDYALFMEYVESENSLLEERLRTTKEGVRHIHAATLEEIAVQYPEFPALFSIAQQLKEKHSKGKGEFERLLTLLPREFAWANDKGEIAYQDHFLRALSQLSAPEQEQVVKQLQTLSNQEVRSTYLCIHEK